MVTNAHYQGVAERIGGIVAGAAETAEDGQTISLIGICFDGLDDSL